MAQGMIRNFFFENYTASANGGELYINHDFGHLLKKEDVLFIVSNWEALHERYFLFFRHQKRYRQVRGLELKNCKIYIKKYLENLSEAEREWNNIIFLWSKGFPTSIPIFFYKSQKEAFLGTKALEGKTILDYEEKDLIQINLFMEKIAFYLAKLHREKIFHQDCYLNHFYWDEKEGLLYLIDVSRILYHPSFSTYYQIKDLSQLKFSFYKYFPTNGEKFWEYFFDTYVKEYNLKLKYIYNMAIILKFLLIKRHTLKSKKLGIRELLLNL